MKGLLASPRRRRRAAKLAVVLAIAVTFTILGVFYSNTSPTRHSAPFTDEPVQTVAPLPTSVKFTPRDRKEVSAAADRFIATAVFRRHLDDSYDLVVPEFRQGLTRAQWDTGSIPVMPFPARDVALTRWTLDYSYRDRVGLKVAFLPKPTAKVGGIVYAIELKKFGTQQHHRWLVSYWSASGGTILSNKQRAAAAGPPQPPLKPKLGAGWILVPVIGILGLILLVPTTLGLRGWRARRRVQSTYAARSS
ncbi:MAG: hypothetical protein QOK32_620 [Gaiellaceae bacterium]|nr:hypothetical protein [Gaiellaceae bacterium]